MNIVFFLLIAASFLAAAWAQIQGQASAMQTLSHSIIASAESAIPLAFGLIGVMSLFLGLMKVAETGGLLLTMARFLSPMLRRLFPDVPPDHPAFGAMVMNVAANMLGLGNAATPFGIRAMEHLDSLNPHRGTASNAQVLFLAINTASVTILPTSVIALRASAGSADPTAVVVPTLLATLASSLVALIAARLLQRAYPLPAIADGLPISTAVHDDHSIAPLPAWQSAAILIALIAAIALFSLYGSNCGPWIIPGLMVGLLGYGMVRGVRIYETFVDGAKEGFAIATRIIPYLVAILVAVGMARQSGAMDILLNPLALLTTPLGIPAEALTMAIIRTLSGSGSFGLLAAQMNDPAIGPDSPLGIMLGTIYASSETTFYVIAVYFGAIAVRRTRHALAVGLLADAAGLLSAAAICHFLYK